jgi:hypothetical protein
MRFQIKPMVGMYNGEQYGRNWKRGHAISFLGIFISNFLYSVVFPTSLIRFYTVLLRRRLPTDTRDPALGKM